jgi:hypothetical protein
MFMSVRCIFKVSNYMFHHKDLLRVGGADRLLFLTSLLTLEQLTEIISVSTMNLKTLYVIWQKKHQVVHATDIKILCF